MSTDQFYNRLPLSELSVNEVLEKEQFFEQMPQDWEVVITDIRGSTKAVQDGMHALVNLVATGSIIAALNIARKAGISIPFFFGGDGATLLIPPSLLKSVMLALIEHKQNTHKNFGLDLRVGNIPIANIYKQNFRLMISKAKMSPIYSIPVILGEGLTYAESIIKKEGYQPHLPEVVEGSLNLEGMECRWDRIRPPRNNFEVVCLLVNARIENRQAEIFKRVLDQIEQVYGPQQNRQPISAKQLKLQSTFTRMRTEIKVKFGKFNLLPLFKDWMKTLFGGFYFQFDKTGKQYLDNLVKLSDTLVMDGRINTVISGAPKQRINLIERLEKIENEGLIFFGIHASEESIMSCYVRDRKDQHVHFVDGSGGGYTQAAGMLKKKIRAAKP